MVTRRLVSERRTPLGTRAEVVRQSGAGRTELGRRILSGFAVRPEWSLRFEYMRRECLGALPGH